MAQDDADGLRDDPALENVLAGLLRQIENEPIPPHLRDLARRLEQALAEAGRNPNDPRPD